MLKENEIFAELVKALKPRLNEAEWEFLLNRGNLYAKHIIQTIKERADKIRETKKDVAKKKRIKQ